ncbi:5'-nucleotidase, C-terminal domain [Nonomuraea solani]|uniref:5'-nucleotidase, C-terminal domain n=1 Tax=Nonomuraea solani TaxID=1144553 RepID=A0A1H5VVR0_9ACTN|nr:5'-nucleotidase [Nonomuraea solani]SEF91290.1 5'-nucleotidase, C-terminal domain [Nonomuraea solani]
MAGRRLGTLVAVVALASGTLVPGAQAAPHPVVFGTASALPKTHTGACPATVTLSTTVKVKAPATLKYVWTFSDGDDGRTRTYRAGGKGLKTVRLSTTVKAVGDARGWGAVRLVSPVKKTSRKASFAVTCTGSETLGAGDVWDSVVTTVDTPGTPDAAATPPPSSSSGQDAARNLVRKATIAFERTTAAKCPVTFKIHGSFEGLPAGAQTVRYRLAGTETWKTVNVPAAHGAVHSTVLETLTWGWETAENSVQIELDQPDRHRSNIIYYFKCRPPSAGTVGVAAEDIPLTGDGGPLAELTADAMLESVRTLSGADLALVSKYGMRKGLKAGPITFSDLYQVQPDGFHPDVWSMTGAQPRKALGHVSPTAGRLTPSAALRYTVTGGVVTDLTLNGTPVSDTQVVKVAANYILRYGGQGFPAWEGAKSVYRGGPDDTGALASYIAAHSPLAAPKGDRVTVR